MIACFSCQMSLAVTAEDTLAPTATSYLIDSDTAYIHIYTDNKGLLKSVSHRHLIAIRNISGTVYWDGVKSHTALILKPANFFVDPNKERKQSSDPRYQHAAANWVKSGTKKNMLGKRLLNVEMYPDIEVNISVASLKNETAVFNVELKIVGQKKRFSRPAILTINDKKLHAYADFTINHSDLGLKPFTAAAGAARVAESLRLIVDINATAIIQNNSETN